MAVEPKFSRLKPLLMTTGLQQKDNRLFQFLDSLVSALVQGQTATNTAISSSSSDISGKPFLTHDVATGIPNYRRLMPGDNISFDDTIANERTVDSSGLVVRDSIDLVTGNIASGATESGELDLTSLGNWETLQLLKLTSDRAGYLVLYASEAERDADARSLPATTDPTAGEGILIDAAFGTVDKLINITPPVLLYNDETPLVDTLYYRFYNAEATAGVTTIGISYVVTISGVTGPSSFPNHNLLSATHPDTTPASGVAGDIVTNQAGAWARLPVGSNGRVLGAVAGNPAWSLDGTSLALDASQLGTGTIPGGRFPATLPAVSGALLTNLNTRPVSPILFDFEQEEQEPYYPPGSNFKPEFGLWTPTIGGSGGQSGQVYLFQHGYWWKYERFVTVHCFVQLSTLGTITGNVEVQGLPFPTVNLTLYRAACAVNWANLNTAVVVVQGFLVSNISVLGLFGMTGAVTTVTQLAQADLTNSTVFAFSISYQI